MLIILDRYEFDRRELPKSHQPTLFLFNWFYIVLLKFNIVLPDSNQYFYATEALSQNNLFFGSYWFLFVFYPMCNTNGEWNSSLNLIRYTKRPLMVGEAGIISMTGDGLFPYSVKDWPIFEGGKLNFAFIPEYFVCYTLCRFMNSSKNSRVCPVKYWLVWQRINLVIYSIIPYLFRYLLICWQVY